MTGHDIIVIGASAGGVEALMSLMRGLPAGLPATVFVVCHFPAGFPSVLPDILSRNGPLLARHARDGEIAYPGHVYVAPPDRHLVLEADRMRLTSQARESHHRPAIDPLFRSAARVFGRRAIGVVLSGALNDGVAGLLAIRAAGGVGVVQDPRDAIMNMLPRQAIELAGADHIVPAAELAALLTELVHRPLEAAGGGKMADPLEHMPAVVDEDMAEQTSNQRRGEVTVFTCPECGGSLWQVDEQKIIRFRCHVGHSYYAQGLMSEQSEALEAALWTAVRTFREKTVLARQLAGQARQQNNPDMAGRFDDQAVQSERYGAVIQQLLEQGLDTSPKRLAASVSDGE